ncbi:MAG: Ig-like domain-containing protein, partial [Bacteroidales bacterium]|nr:Ig-like domain-containing protein [Bacteroidales bacterium]
MNSVFKCFVFVTLLSLTTYLHAQEICNNGIDDDGDGLVDIFDPDCTDNVGNEYFYFGQPVPTCREKPPVLDKYTLELKYRSETGFGLDQRCGVFVGDLDGDGVPELVGKDGAKNGGTNKIRVFNGIDGSHLVSYSAGNHHYSQVVIANLGTAENYQGCIFFVNGSGKVVRLDYTKTDNGDGTFSHALTQGAISTQSAHSGEASPQIADFDMDGSPEIYVGNFIYDAATLSYYDGDANYNQGRNNVDDAWAFAYDVFKSGDIIPGTTNTFGSEADGLELIAGNKIYTVDLTAAPGSVLQEAIAVDIDGFTNPLTGSNADGFTSIGDIDNNGKIDVIVSAAEGDPKVYVYNPYTAQQIGTTFTVRTGSTIDGKTSARAGRCNVADFDNDGFVEIGLAGLHTYVVIEYNQSLNTLEMKWRKDGTGRKDGTEIYDASQMTGSTLFDFEGDGNAEVVYSDEYNLYIWRGSDGTELAKVTSGSGTRTDYPLVADADDDGQAEIIISAQSTAGSGSSGGDDYIAVYRSKDAPWVAARETWNQHGYIVTNVGADLIIPQTQQEIVLPVEGVNYNFLEKYNQAFNGFLVQTTFLTQDAEPTFAVGDLTTENVTINVDECVSVKEITFTVTLENNGDWKTPRKTPVAVFDGDPYEELATYLGTFYTSKNVEVGSSIEETYTVTDPNADGDLDLYVLANHYEENLAVGEALSATLEKNNSPTLECNYVNNVGFIVSIRNCQITNAPQIDLDRDNSEGTEGRDYKVAFAIKESADDVLTPVAISDTDNLIADEDGATIQSATIVLTNRPDGAFESINHPDEGTTVGGITITKEASGDITLSGAGTLAEYENIIKAITYQNTKLTGINQEDRVINVTVEDPDGNSSNTAVATILLKVKPNLDLDSDDSSVAGRDFVSSFTENTSGTPVADADVIINTDGSIDLQSVTFELTNPQDASKELLQVNGSLPAGISVSTEYENGINILELSGAASAADYQTAIRKVEYLNASDNPTITDRIIEVKVNDGFLESLVAQATISVIPVNDAPVVDGPSTAVEYQISDPAVSIMSNVDISDADDLNMVSAEIEITSNFESGVDVLSETYTGALVIDSSTPGILKVSGDATIGEYETLLNSLTFVTTGSVGVREVSITVNDGDDNSVVYNRTIVVGTAANDAPVAADDAYEIDEGVVLNISAALGLMRNDEDFDIGVISGEQITVTAVDAASHGTLDWAADGSFEYTQSGDGSLGAGETLVETLNYTITDNGGLTDSGVLTITINGVNNDPIANDDNHNVDENGSITVNAAGGLLANDSDVNTPNDVLLVQTVEGTSTGNNVGTYGTLVWSTLGDFTYTPDNANTLVSEMVAGESVVETFSYTMHDGNGGTATANLAVTIDGENDAPVITATDITLAEGITTVQTVTATDEDASETKEFSVSGTDADDFDIDPSTGELTFKNATDYENPTDDGANNIYNITVTVKDKSGLTDSKDIVISVTNIIDALTLQFGAATYTDAENTGGDIPVVVAAGEVLPADVAVNATITGGNASITDDFTYTALVTIPAGDYTTPQNIAISLSIVDEALAENDETITFELSGQSAGVSLGTQTTTTYTIQNDDIPSITLSLTDSPIVENGGVATITATTDILSVKDIIVNLINTGTATIINDYTMAGSISIPAGQTKASIPLTAVQDVLDETNETVITDISTVINGAENGTQQVTTTITDDDNAPNVTLSVDNASIAENGGVATVRAEIDAPSALPVTVTLAYSGTATLGGTDATTAAGSNANS